MKEKLFENVGGNKFKLKKLNEEISQKSIITIKKWINEVGTRQASIKIIDFILNKRVGLSSADLPDTATFANGLDEMEDLLKKGDYKTALMIGMEAAQAMVEEEGGMGLFEKIDGNKLNEEEGSSQPNVPVGNLIMGQSNNVAASRVNKILQLGSKGIFSDNSWEAINNIFKKLKEVGLEVTVLSAKYGGQGDTSNGMPKYKEWQISIPFINNKGKSVQLVGQITAHGAGSVEQPLDRYDITAYVTAVNVK